MYNKSFKKNFCSAYITSPSAKGEDKERTALEALSYSLKKKLKQPMQPLPVGHPESIESHYSSLQNEIKAKSYIYSQLSKEERSRLGLQVHHLLPKHDGGDDSPSNLVFLSIENHALAHFWRYQLYNQRYDKQAVFLILSNPVTRAKLFGKRAKGVKALLKKKELDSIVFTKGDAKGESFTGLQIFDLYDEKGITSPKVMPSAKGEDEGSAKGITSSPPVKKVMPSAKGEVAPEDQRDLVVTESDSTLTPGTDCRSASCSQKRKKISFVLTRYLRWYSKKSDQSFVTPPCDSLESLCKEVQRFVSEEITVEKLTICLDTAGSRHNIECMVTEIV